MITEDYVSFDIAKLLKDKGFEQEPDYATSWYANQYYKNSCLGEWFEGEHQIIEDINDKCSISYLSECGIFIPAPTLQMAMKWLREVHNIFVCIVLLEDIDGYGFTVENTVNKKYIATSKNDGYSTYEQSCEEAIKYCLENLI